MFEKANRLQDPKNRTTPPGSPLFYVFKVGFRYVVIRESIISGVYWLSLAQPGFCNGGVENDITFDHIRCIGYRSGSTKFWWGRCNFESV